MPNFTLIANGLEVWPALAELAALPDIYWSPTHGDADLLVALLGPDGRRRQQERLPAVWALIEQVHAVARRDFGDGGEIDFARVGKLPPGKTVQPHADGHDGVLHRRYQIMLASGPTAALTLDGERRTLKPGEAWQIDTTKIHSALNSDDVPRINILFDSRAGQSVPGGAEMPNFRIIAERVDVARALAELKALPDYYWLQINADRCVYVRLLDHDETPVLEDELPETWRLIGRLQALLAEQEGDRGALCHCRIGLMPPGEGLAPHFDGIDGIRHRRYQLALQSAPGVELIVGGERRCPRPGDLWQIAANRTHSVHNHSPVDRMTLLFDTLTPEAGSSRGQDFTPAARRPACRPARCRPDR